VSDTCALVDVRVGHVFHCKKIEYTHAESPRVSDTCALVDVRVGHVFHYKRIESTHDGSPVPRVSDASPPKTTPWLYVHVVPPLFLQFDPSPSLTRCSLLIMPDELSQRHISAARAMPAACISRRGREWYANLVTR
jgi:hypothetical protein